jgi:hypothetical protein
MRVLCIIATLLVVSACDPGAVKRVRLLIPALTGSGDKVPLENHTVRDAVGIVDAVVKEYGLRPDTNEQTRETRVIRQYAAGLLYHPPPGASRLNCRVELALQGLEVLFVEFPKWRSSPDVVKMRNEIRSEFVNQFGEGSVR